MSTVDERRATHRSRRRASRILAEKRRKGVPVSCDDESPTRERAKPPRRKKKEPLYEEDVVDGFAILSFKNYEDIEISLKMGRSSTNGLSPSNATADESPTVKVEPSPIIAQKNCHDKLGQDAHTSDDSCKDKDKRNPVIKRDPESEDNRLSDASSRCSSGKGYICDSEDDDKASDSGSVLFSASPPPVRKHEPVSEVSVVNGHGVVKTNGSPRPETPPPAVATVSVPVATSVQPIQSSQSTHTSTTSSSASHFTPLSNGVTKVERLSPPPQSACVSSPRMVVGAPSIYSRPNMYPASYPPPPQAGPPASCLPPHPAAVPPAVAVASSSPAPPPSYHHPPLYAPYNTTPYLPPAPTTHQPPQPPHQAHPSHSAAHPPVPHQTHQPHQSPHQPPHPPPHQLFMPKTEQKVLNQRFHPEVNYVGVNCKPQERKHIPQEIQPMTRSPIGLKPISSMVCPPVATSTPTTSHRDMVGAAVTATSLVGRSHSPRGHSPTRERDSYSSNVSSLSRGSVGTPVSLPSPYTAPPSHHQPPQPPPPPAQQPSSLSYNKPSVWVSSGSSSQVSPAAGRHPSSLTHPQPHPFPPAPMFPPAPVAAAPPVSTAPPPPPPNPFSAESLFQSNQGDLLRRELDSRFLASQDRGPYIRTEMHHHQHQHTHVHQHTTPIIPPPPPTLFTPPIFKEIPKGAAVDTPFYRQALGFTGYPGYSPGLLHPTFGPMQGTTPFAPPTHLPTFTPKQLTEPSKPKTMKTGKWNAMHVRVAWEIYHHQQKGGLTGESKVGTLVGKSDMLRPPTHMFGPPHAYPPSHRAPPAFDPAPPPTFPPIGGSMFGRYGPTASFPSLPGFAHAPALHDPWARLQTRGVTSQGFPGPPGPWGLKPDPNEEREREKERERSRERERAKREEKQRRLAASAAAAAAASKAAAAVRDRSPLREPPNTAQVPASSKDDEMSMLARPPQHFLRQPPRPLPPHFPPNPWEHTYRYDPLRYNPIVAALREEEEQRAKLFGGYPAGPPGVPTHLRPKAPSPPTHRLPPTSHQPKEESSQSR
ncbi:uncharacterized protein isoform X3 [Rhodnius prolixus]|uniref:uncharacterized protein isoform X3 n=1 Tax=Rhodnius prolixus TaxID=13249 RepID=UPI003D18C711